MVKQIREAPVTNTNLESATPIRQAQQAIKLHKMSKSQRPQYTGARCPVSHRTSDPEDLERDFTTEGVQGSLGCPFAKMANGLAPSTHKDPIAAEFHQDQNSAQSPNVEQRPGQCPIRFLEQHSPEEVAKYFENHKHEIPRSHEICVRRYSANETSARQLDAKYGNLVNMIQGLGVKHKAYLPERDRIEERDKSSSHVVENWADNVSQEPTPAAPENEVTDEEPRLPRFERPLREVRVGESPSRPWGISVPADKEPTPSALQDEDAVAHLKIQPGSSGSSQRAQEPTTNGQSADQAHKTPKQKEQAGDPVDIKDHRAHIVFNGPVFFGYSADEVAMLLQRTNLADMKPGGG